MADDVVSPLGEAPQAPTVFTSRKASTEEAYQPGEAEIVEWVEGLQQDAEQARNDQCDVDAWSDDERVYWGEQWSGRIPSFKPRIVVNEIQSLILQDISDLTDSRVRVYVQKRGKSDREKVVEESVQAYWTQKFCDLTVLKAALDALIFPLGFFQTGWDPTAEQGQGEIIFTNRDPRTVYPDADAEDDSHLRYFVLEDILDLIQIRQDFPETGMRVLPEDAWSEKTQEHRERPAPRAGSGYTGPLYSKSPMGQIPGYRKARARLLTCVVDDPEKIEEINEVAGILRQRVVPKYPNRRMILVANRRVLFDDDCAYHHAPILTRVALQPTVHGYWPWRSVVNSYGEIQSTANKLDSIRVHAPRR